MEKDKEMREQFSKILGAPMESLNVYAKNTIYSWEEIFNEIGKLQERASKTVQYYPIPSVPTQADNRDYHFHNGMKCYQNPCVWC